MKILLVIPVYNNVETIWDVIKKSRILNPDILVVNDGSTDGTGNILEYFEKTLNLLNIPVNKGKGNAIREASEWARRNGFSHILTIDADGQHDPDEIDKFLNAIKSTPDSIIIGCRDFSVHGIPFLSRIGRKLSNTAFRILTGVKLIDTQSGFRAYPINTDSKLKCLSNRYDFEMEIILKAALQKINIKEISVSVKYTDKTRQASNFKPLKDTLRIIFLFVRTLPDIIRKGMT